MKIHGFFYLIILVGILSCEINDNQSNLKADDFHDKSVNIIETEAIILDTLLEKNSPKFLNLKTHQLFIDTSHDSEFYDEIMNWEPGEFDNEGTKYYLELIEEEFGRREIDLKEFSSDWVTIHKLHNQYVLYSPNNGISGRYKITKHSVNFYAMESDAEAINSLEKLDKNNLILNLKTIPEKSESKTSIFSIQKTQIDFVYLLKWKYDNYEIKRLVTPLENINKFDMVVHHSQELVNVPINFDKINYEAIENDL